MRGRIGGAWMLGALACVGCYRTAVTTDTREGQRSERRVPAAADAPLWRATWHVEADAVVGELDVQECQARRAWTTLDVRTTERIPYRSSGWAFVGVGSLASVTSAVTWDHEVTSKCDDPTFTPSGAPVFAPCRVETADNTFPKFMLGTAVVLGMAGLVMLLQPGGTTTEVLDRRRHQTSTTESCFTGNDLKEMIVVARDAAGHIWPVRLTSTGEARIPLPQTPDVPRGVEIELVVYRAPRSSGGLYSRGLVLDTFVLPSGGATPEHATRGVQHSE